MDELDSGLEHTAPVWAVFGDLMSGLLGAFVMILVGVMGVQMELTSHLQDEVKKRQVEEQRRMTLEKALAVPLGQVLFALNSNQLQPEGRQVLKSLVSPLRAYLGARKEMLMVSGFTDDTSIRGGPFADNWELSAQRALTVTRTLIDEGMPASMVFAAAFGSGQPVKPNTDDAARALNRRVEMAPVPKTTDVKTAPNG
jgi:flagellar motor protein MotB